MVVVLGVENMETFFDLTEEHVRNGKTIPISEKRVRIMFRPSQADVVLLLKKNPGIVEVGFQQWYVKTLPKSMYDLVRAFGAEPYIVYGRCKSAKRA